jgi:nucleotide-binding universal stress UspA family protein
MREVAGDLESWFRESAEATATEGAELAREAGLEASAEAVDSGSSAWRVLAATAESRRAAVVVVGSEGQGRASSVLLGSVSAGLVHHAERPVLVIRP